MRVLYIIGGAKAAYGSEKVALNLIEGLSIKGVEYVVITANDGPINKLCRSLHIENYVIPFRFYVYKESKGFLNGLKREIRLTQADFEDLKACKRIESIVDMHTIDLIHSNLSRNMVGARLSEKYDIPHIWYLQELLTGHYGLSCLMKNQLEWMNQHCDQYIAISEAVKESWENGGLDGTKIKRIYNGIDVERYYNKNDHRCNDCIHLVMVGELCELKGQHILLEALHRMGNKAEQFSVDFYGDGKEPFVNRLHELAAGLKVNFHGFVNGLEKVLGKYDVGIIASKGEGFGLSTLEFMAAGLCVVASDTGANTELINNSEVGFVFERNSCQELATVLQIIIDNPSIVYEKGRRAQERAIGSFGNERYLGNILVEYKEVLNSRRYC